jgi:hypothetical protein
MFLMGSMRKIKPGDVEALLQKTNSLFFDLGFGTM